MLHLEKSKSFSKTRKWAVLGVLVGYTETGYRILLPKAKKIIGIKRVRFIENKTFLILIN